MNTAQPAPTPETDAETGGIGGERVDADFARKLERERDEAERRLRLVGFYGDNGKEIIEMEAQIVALREALTKLLADTGTHECGDGGKFFSVSQRQARQALSTPPPACVPLEYVHSLLDGPPAQIIRNAKDGYPEGRENRVLSIEERIAALKCFASDYKRWLEELEELTGRKHP